MPSNFQIDVIQQDVKQLYLRLRGDFDGASAYRLLNIIHSKRNGFRKIILDTDALRKIHSFGSDLFRANIRALQNQGVEIVFIGKAKPDFGAD